AAMVMAYALVIITPLRVTFYGMPEENVDWLGFPAWLQIVIMLGLIFVLIGYYWLCWRKQGQSMGMKAWRLKLVQSNGELATNQQCWLRAIIAPLSLAFFGIGYLWCLLPPNKECIHDRITGTKVVVVPKIGN
ncbi:MAG: RDD family protein, partial [Porticoccaceae bacterium]|nr:RDD family protein [Porticoccaceae bacterium]